MATTPSSNGQPRMVSPEEGSLMLAKALLATVQQHGDIAAEQTWQDHAQLMLRHGQRFIEQLGMLQVLKLQQMCAEMVLKIRLSQQRTPASADEDILASYESMMEAVFAPEDVPTDMPEDSASDDTSD